jgi:hypothetical protein
MSRSWKLWIVRRLGAFVVAAAIMVVFGSAAHSYFVQQAWSRAAGEAYGTAPAAIPFADRLSWAAHDLLGMLIPYCALTSAALLIAFLVAGGLTRFAAFRVTLFAVAGAAALLVLFVVMRRVLGTVGVFGARGTAGLVAQMAIGAAAGMVFACLTRPLAPRAPSSRS